ncbi:MAG: NADH-quinone oxidoreductase subunit K [Acidobacteria bacterium]|nr:NADH-quinone oxidoreductase subunit K [Acidobacteriota bacterium]
MRPWIDALMVALVLADLALLGSSRLRVWVRIVAAQGLLLGILPVLAENGDVTLRMFFLATVSIGLRGVVFPRLLLRALRQADVRREVEPYVGYTASLVFGFLALVASAWVDSRINLANPAFSPLAGLVAIFTVLVGLFLIISRKKAISQVLGYLVMENGIYILGISLVTEVPMLVELGVLLDAFVAVFVMCIATYHISREFDHIDVDQLDTLKG